MSGKTRSSAMVVIETNKNIVQFLDTPGSSVEEATRNYSLADIGILVLSAIPDEQSV